MASLIVIFVTVVASLFLVTQVTAVSTSNSGAGRVYKLHVTQDVALEWRNRNHNSLPFLMVGRHPKYPNKRSLVQFESLPRSCPARKIRWAKMYLYYMYAHKPSWHSIRRTPFITRYLHTYLVKKSWNERQATRRYRLRNVRWLKAYLGLDNKDAESRPQSGVVPIYTNRPRGWVEFDVTRAVKSWRRGIRNYGLLIRATNELTAGRDIRFASNASKDKGKHAFINVLCSY